MAVGTWPPGGVNFETQTPDEYKGGIDNSLAVSERAARNFAAHESGPPDMSVVIDPGHIWNGASLTEVAQQTVGPVVAPSALQRIDRVVLSEDVGIASIVTGAEDVAPEPPAIPSGQMPCAQLLLAPLQGEITNQDMIDERAAGGAGGDPLTPEQSELTIDDGAIDPDLHYHSVDTEADAVADDLETINTASLGDGALLILRAEDAARVVTARAVAPGGNLNLATGDFALDKISKRIALQRRGLEWDELWRSNALPGLVSLVSQTVTAPVGTVDFVDLPVDEYSAFLLIGAGVRHGDDLVRHYMRVRRAGLGVFDSSANYQISGAITQSGSTVNNIISGNVESAHRISQGLSNVPEASMDFYLWVYNLSSTAVRKHWRSVATYTASSAEMTIMSMGGSWKLNQEAFDGIQFLAAAGNIVGGKFELFGFKGA